MAVKFNVSGAWRNVGNLYIKAYGTWQKPAMVYHKIEGVWKKVYTDASALRTYYFCNLHRSAEEHHGANAPIHALYGILSYNNYGIIRAYPHDGSTGWSEKEVWRVSDFYIGGDDFHVKYPSSGLYKIHFDYPPAGGFSDKEVYICAPSEFGIGHGYKVNEPQRINAGTNVFYFNGSTFTMV